MCEFLNICLIGLNRPIYNARSVFLASVPPDMAQSHLHFKVTLSIEENALPRHRGRRRFAARRLSQNGPTDTNRCDVTGH